MVNPVNNNDVKNMRVYSLEDLQNLARGKSDPAWAQTFFQQANTDGDQYITAGELENYYAPPPGSLSGRTYLDTAEYFAENSRYNPNGTQNRTKGDRVKEAKDLEYNPIENKTDRDKLAAVSKDKSSAQGLSQSSNVSKNPV